jgi:hypothetical protein
MKPKGVKKCAFGFIFCVDKKIEKNFQKGIAIFGKVC